MLSLSQVRKAKSILIEQLTKTSKPEWLRGVGISAKYPDSYSIVVYVLYTTSEVLSKIPEVIRVENSKIEFEVPTQITIVTTLNGFWDD
jgi:hypothetical protein